MTTIVRPGRRGVREEKHRHEQEAEEYPYRALWHCRECGCRFRVTRDDPISHTYGGRNQPEEWEAGCPNPECSAWVRLTEPFPIGCAVLLALALVGFVAVLLLFGRWS